MKQPMKFVPQSCQGENAKFEGHVMVLPPSFPQRFEYIEASGFEIDEKGDIKTSMKQLKALANMFRLAEPHISAVDLKKKSDGTEIKSFEALADDPDCDGINMEIASHMMNGFRLSKN